MQPLAFLLEEGGDRAGRIGGLQQLEPDVADPEEADPDLLVGDLLDALEDRPQSLLVERPLGLDGADGDPDVVDRP